ncbi:hypothetical protein PO124_00025 [Bacillus licheniformis]|nr:hypothetical protein [Bacillus licheniformis]
MEDALYENPPLSLKEGNLIKDGYHAKLDEYRDASKNGKTGSQGLSSRNASTRESAL